VVRNLDSSFDRFELKMTKAESSWYLWLVTGLYVVVSASVFRLINNVQPEPYMDEIFHIPQARKYCNGKFTEVRLF
jgi:hypothetical protein